MKNKIEALFEEWRYETVEKNVSWMKGVDVVRAMRKTLETCERESRGEITAHKDGKSVVLKDGSQGELKRNQPVSITEAPSAVSNGTQSDCCCTRRITDKRTGCCAREVHRPRIPDQRLHHRCARQHVCTLGCELCGLIRWLLAFGVGAGLDEKGSLLDRGIDKIARELNGTDSHENKHDVSLCICSRRFSSSF